MNTSTALILVQNATSNLQSQLTYVMPVLVGAVIAVAVLFAGIIVLKGLWHRFF